jgi:hypothetical protein
MKPVNMARIMSISCDSATGNTVCKIMFSYVPRDFGTRNLCPLFNIDYSNIGWCVQAVLYVCETW